MLTVTLTPPSNCIYTASGYFDYEYKDEWLDDPVVRQMILDIDNTTVVSSHLCESPILGPIPPRDLSGGVKGLILIMKDEDHREYSSTIFGGNCVPWLTRLSFQSDYTIYMEHSLELYSKDQRISAIGMDNTIFNTEREVWLWYVNNYSKYQD